MEWVGQNSALLREEENSARNKKKTKNSLVSFPLQLPSCKGGRFFPVHRCFGLHMGNFTGILQRPVCNNSDKETHYITT